MGHKTINTGRVTLKKKRDSSGKRKWQKVKTLPLVTCVCLACGLKQARNRKELTSASGARCTACGGNVVDKKYA